MAYLAHAVAAAVLLAAATVQAATVYVASNGVDEAACGPQDTPCRSITLGIAKATPGDTVEVGPGRYGDLGLDGNLGGPGNDGDEVPSPGCGCVLSVNKPVIVVSSAGAAATVIDGESVNTATNVLLILNGGEFGRPGKGFTVTRTAASTASGIVVDSANVKVRGNQVVTATTGASGGVGIRAIFGGPVLVEGNQVIGNWSYGIRAQGTGKVVRKNQVSLDGSTGIGAEGDSAILGNVVVGSGVAVAPQDAAKIIGNGLYGNSYALVVSDEDFAGVIERNNIHGSRGCGLTNDGVPGLVVARNYWGQPTGPVDPDPSGAQGRADEICTTAPGTTITTPFATRPFLVRAPIRP